MATKTARKTKAERAAIAKVLERAERRRALAFERKTPNQKRVAIALDVIKQVQTRRLVATRGTYVALTVPSPVQAEDQVCDLTAGRKCAVCGIGALFIATVERADKLTAADLVGSWATGQRILNLDGDDCRRYLSRFFLPETTRLIESYFEGWSWPEEQCIQWHGLDPDDRLIRLMRNIVRNRGRFVPSQLSAK